MNITIYIISNAKTPQLYALTQQAVNTARATTPEGTRIVVYEQNMKADFGAVEHHLNKDDPFNYSAACNWCVEDCQTEFIGIFNNDVIFYPNWWARMQFHFHEDSELMAARPICFRSHKGGDALSSSPQYGYKTRVHVCGWALVFRKSLIDIIGPFDEDLEFWCSDSDYGRRMQEAGVKNALIPTARVDHLESQTLKTMTGEQQHYLCKVQNDKFKAKWKGTKQG